MNIDSLICNSLEKWQNSDGCMFNAGNIVNGEKKKDNEEYILRLAEKVKRKLVPNANLSVVADFKKEYAERIGLVLKKVFGFNDSELSVILGNGFTQSTKKFSAMAREFDPEIKPAEIFQASRNLWITNTLQHLLGVEVHVSPSLFAYSMLYPYTDNYIDNPKVSPQVKREFSDRFRLRLCGEKVTPQNEHESRIFRLVEIIENDWCRNEFPKLFESLIAIHDAQTRSICLTKGENKHVTDDELLSICIDKGGTSVLADGYLVNGRLTPEQQEFCFEFGVLLQFVDDVQDLKEDLDEGTETAFTRALKNGKLEEMINRSMSFSNAVLNNFNCFDIYNTAHFRSLMLKSINFLMVESVGLNRSFLNKEFVNGVEKQSVVSFDFLNKYRNKMSENRVSIMKNLTNVLIDEMAVA